MTRGEWRAAQARFARLVARGVRKAREKKKRRQHPKMLSPNNLLEAEAEGLEPPSGCPRRISSAVPYQLDYASLFYPFSRDGRI